MANFDFQAFKNGKVATTKTGSKAKFVCETRGQMLVAITEKFGKQYTLKYNLDGKKYSGVENGMDLEM